MIDIKLITLLKLAELKNFTRVAQELSMTQPAVSHHILQLEEEFATRLVIRKKNSIILTDEGKIAVNYAKKIQSLYDKMEQEIKFHQHNITNLRIGITHTSESNIMMEVLAKCSNEIDNLNITIITDTIKNLYNMLDNFEIDLAIIEEKADTSKYKSLLIDTDYLVCILSKENRLAKKSIVTINDLKKEKMILRLPSSATRKQFHSNLIAMNENVENFNIIMEVDNIDTIKNLVRKNLGISILARSACLYEIKKNKLIALPIENLSMIRETNIIYNDSFNAIPILQDIYRIYQETKLQK